MHWYHCIQGSWDEEGTNSNLREPKDGSYLTRERITPSKEAKELKPRNLRTEVAASSNFTIKWKIWMVTPALIIQDEWTNTLQRSILISLHHWIITPPSPPEKFRQCSWIWGAVIWRRIVRYLIFQGQNWRRDIQRPHCSVTTSALCCNLEGNGEDQKFLQDDSTILSKYSCLIILRECLTTVTSTTYAKTRRSYRPNRSVERDWDYQ